MTGLQDHPGTGRTLSGKPTGQLVFEEVAKAMGIPNVHTLRGGSTTEDLENLLREALVSNELTVIIVRNPCLLSAKRIHERKKGTTVEDCKSQDEQSD
jgi:indolepyruvate ferredoxin oxidoreductase alpha subunit